MIITDPKRAAPLASEVARRMASDEPSTFGFAEAREEGKRLIALVIKRTYNIGNNRCEPAKPAEQEVLQAAERPYDPTLKAPFRSPPAFVNDGSIRRRRTDVVVQGVAYAYAPNTRKLTASVRFGKHERSIAVYGDRRGEFDRMGQPRFSEPLPIKAVPVRYDFAYGGPDMTALARSDDPRRRALNKIRPEYNLDAFTPYHYPRNPCGVGYLMTIDEASFDGLPIPNLEYPFAPLSPAKLAVGHPKRWLSAPLPAGWDWQSEGWFPRSGYVGMARAVEDPDAIPAEVKLGWAARDILSIPPIYEDPAANVRVEYGQAASPGMSVDDLSPGESFVLENLHPRKPLHSFKLPPESLRAKLGLARGALTELTPHLDSVVIRPTAGQVIMVWSARTFVERSYSYDQLMNMRREVRWIVPPGGA